MDYEIGRYQENFQVTPSNNATHAWNHKVKSSTRLALNSARAENFVRIVCPHTQPLGFALDGTLSVASPRS